MHWDGNLKADEYLHSFPGRILENEKKYIAANHLNLFIELEKAYNIMTLTVLNLLPMRPYKKVANFSIFLPLPHH